MAIPISVIVTTKNEEPRLAACLAALSRFDDVWVVDSNSTDKTAAIAELCGARVEPFTWNGVYPKKRQWCLDHLDLKYERLFFVDADEIISPALVDEIVALDWAAAGYFVRGRYVFGGRVLKHGLQNNKLVLFDRRKIEFPVVDDLDLVGMGEMEGHYQPVLKAEYHHEKIGQLCTPMLHAAYEDAQSWYARHVRYAQWEAGMNAKGAWPVDPKSIRNVLKRVFRAMPFRNVAAFLQSYVFKLGFLDGRAGFAFACSRARYYGMIKRSEISGASIATAQDFEAAKASPVRR